MPVLSQAIVESYDDALSGAREWIIFFFLDQR
jgi:hypothetical protein